MVSNAIALVPLLLLLFLAWESTENVRIRFQDYMFRRKCRSTRVTQFTRSKPIKENFNKEESN